MMKTQIYFLLICLQMSFLTVEAQLFEEFKKDFKWALEQDLTKDELNRFFRDYDALITPHSDITQLEANLKGREMVVYPLSAFRYDPLYTDNIENLLNAENPYQRILSYLVIAASGDTSFEDVLINKLKIETGKGNLIWAGMALMHTKSDRTTPIFDFLVEHETLGDAHMLPLFFSLNKDSLQQTAFRRINSEIPKAKVIAVQMLSVTEFNPEVEKVLRDAVRNWDIRIKGYAIYSMKEFQMGNLLDLMKPLLDSAATSRIALEALANSPTEEDSKYLKERVSMHDTIPKDLLNSFLYSKRPDHVAYGLSMLYTKTLPEDYYLWVRKQPLLYEDSLLPDILKAIQALEDPKVIEDLLSLLLGRQDEESLALRIALLRHENSEVRAEAARSLRGINTLQVADKVIELLDNTSLRTSALIELALSIEMDSLHASIEPIFQTFQTISSSSWKTKSMEYFSTYPTENQKDIFKSILTDTEENFYMKRLASLGLGGLKDVSSVDLIIEAMKEESPADSNARLYLIALGMIKGEKAKAVILQYKDSREPIIAELVETLLKEW